MEKGKKPERSYRPPTFSETEIARDSDGAHPVEEVLTDKEAIARKSASGEALTAAESLTALAHTSNMKNRRTVAEANAAPVAVPQQTSTTLPAGAKGSLPPEKLSIYREKKATDQGQSASSSDRIHPGKPTT